MLTRANLGGSQWASEQQGMRLGIVAVLHTFGGDLKWHPHLHLLVTEGGLSLDASRWVRPYGEGWLMAHGALKTMWRYHVVHALRRAHRAGELRFLLTQTVPRPDRRPLTVAITAAGCLGDGVERPEGAKNQGKVDIHPASTHCVETSRHGLCT